MRLWIVTIILAEILMFVLNRHLVVIYLAVSVIFFLGVLLRILKLYPGNDEPLILDGSAVVLALIWAFLARVIGMSGWRFLLILSSSAIVMPHLWYVINMKEV
ncbi:hypothetical protein ACFL5Y_03620 [Candidatus Omnitrophota bacterium]